MEIPMQNESDKVKPSFTLDGEDHPMVKGMQPGKMYHMKVHAKMVGKDIHDEQHSGRFEIHHAEEHGSKSYKEILKDGAEEESPKHEKTESKREEKSEGEE